MQSQYQSVQMDFRTPRQERKSACMMITKLPLLCAVLYLLTPGHILCSLKLPTRLMLRFCPAGLSSYISYPLSSVPWVSAWDPTRYLAYLPFSDLSPHRSGLLDISHLLSVKLINRDSFALLLSHFQDIVCFHHQF